MVTLGTDAHKQTHTVVAVDGNGRQLGQKTVKAVSSGHLEALRWAAQWSERRWAIEDCRHVSRRLEAELLAAGESVLRVSPKLMGQSRKGGRTQGKSDPIDALAVARAALREPDLPVAKLEGSEREVRLLVDHREDLGAERTRMQNRLRWHLHELEPSYRVPARALNRFKVLAELEAHLGPHQGLVADIARELVGRIRELTVRVKELEREIERRVAVLTPSLLALDGCAALTAGKILGETAGVSRFRSRAAYAMHNGTAPIPVWSGNPDRHRLNPGGNRQLNAALHRIAVTQLQRRGAGRDYYERRIRSGDTEKEALRALRRRVSDEVYRRLRADERPSETGQDRLRNAA